MNKNKNNQKSKNRKTSENKQILANYNAWLKTGEPAIDTKYNKTLPQDPAKPFKRCYNGRDKIYRQLPKCWFVREDRTLISFKKGRKILTVPHVVHLNTCMSRPSYCFIANGKSKQITDYDLATLVWHKEAIYGNARQLLESSLAANLGKREANKNKAHGHHYNDRSNNDRIMIADTEAHDFCHNAPRTDTELTAEQRQNFVSKLDKVAMQEPNKITLFCKTDGCENGVLRASKEMFIRGDALFQQMALTDPQGNFVGTIDIASILLAMGYKIDRPIAITG